MNEEKIERFMAQSIENQEEIIGRLRINQSLLNQMALKPQRYSKPPKNLKDSLSLPDAAKQLGIGESAFRNKAVAGEIPFFYINGVHGRRFTQSDLKKFITARSK